jgi:hypothetical protein
VIGTEIDLPERLDGAGVAVAAWQADAAIPLIFVPDQVGEGT